MAIVSLIRPPFATAMGLVLTTGMGIFNAIHLSASCALASSVSVDALDYMSLGTALAGLAGWPLVLLIDFTFTKLGLSTETTIKSPASQVESMTVLVVFIIAALVCTCFIPYYIVEMQSDYKVLVDEDANKLAVEKRKSILDVLSTVFGTGLIAWLILFITFLVFPSQVLKWKPSFSHYPGAGTFFYSNMLIYTFQIFDVIGRYMSMLRGRLTSSFVMNLTWPRIFIALMFFLCTLNYGFFRGDAARLVIVGLFALTNGLLISWVFRFGCEQAGPSGADAAGSIISFFLVNGIFVGSMIALGIGGPKPTSSELLETDILKQLEHLIELGPESLQPM